MHSLDTLKKLNDEATQRAVAKSAPPAAPANTKPATPALPRQ